MSVQNQPVYEVELFDEGMYICSMDLKGDLTVGRIFSDDSGIEMQIVKVLEVDHESRMAKIEVEYTV